MYKIIINNSRLRTWQNSLTYIKFGTTIGTIKKKILIANKTTKNYEKVNLCISSSLIISSGFM